MEQAQVKELVQQAVARAREDAAFRDAVLADPRGAVEREFGVTLPADLDVEGMRQRAQSRFQAVPAEGELSDEQLEAVAGGKGIGCFPIFPEDVCSY